MSNNNDISAKLNFFSHTVDGSAPCIDASYTMTLTKPIVNFIPASTDVIIHNMRDQENTFDLDTQGFEVHKYNGQVNNEFHNGDEQQRIYYEELADLLKKRLDASRVIVFNHVFRYRGPSRAIDLYDTNHQSPAVHPHVDFDGPGVYLKLKEVVGEEEAKKLACNRFQLINIWRPIGFNIITRNPLTLCDYRSLDLKNDVHLTELRGSIISYSIYTISHNAQNTQKWYYLNEMRSDELLVFKMFDSDPNVAQFCAHTGFINDHVPMNNIEQISLEARCFVFYDR
ncbi:unnamed protein product [Adineta steineri]|uniref:Methyltransferase-like protein n=1 Tax=Adineta steineri TaxID=433720 RepID=A0A814EYF7_9BILA|nr:unnamed protein product [Adineta steineri]